MAILLHEVLERRFGVDEEEFAAALVEFADRVGAVTLVDIRPADYFGDRQQAALRKVGTSLKPLQPNELGAVAGLAAAHAELVKRSHRISTVAKRLGVDTSRVRQHIYARSLYAFKQRGSWLVPSFQLDGRKLVPGLGLVVAELSPMLHPVAVSRWFTTPNADLSLGGEPVPPVAWLSSGGSPDLVASLAGGIDQL